MAIAEKNPSRIWETNVLLQRASGPYGIANISQIGIDWLNTRGVRLQGDALIVDANAAVVNFRGDYDGTQAYSGGDGVRFTNGQMYVATGSAAAGVAPPAAPWALFGSSVRDFALLGGRLINGDDIADRSIGISKLSLAVMTEIQEKANLTLGNVTELSDRFQKLVENAFSSRWLTDEDRQTLAQVLANPPTKEGTYLYNKQIFKEGAGITITPNDGEETLTITSTATGTGTGDGADVGDRVLQIGANADAGDSAKASREDHVHNLALAPGGLLGFDAQNRLRYTGTIGLTQAQVDARAMLAAAARYTNTEKRKLAGLEGGAIAVNPSRIDAYTDIDGNYTLVAKALDVATLNAAGVDQYEIWFKDEGVHTASWTPTADFTVAFNVSTSEETQVGLGSTDKIVPVQLVFRSRGNFVSRLFNWIQIGSLGGGGTGDISQATFDAEVKKRVSGDDIQSITVGTTSQFNTALTSQASSDQPLEIVFTSTVVLNAGTARQETYNVGDVLYFSPRSNSPERRFNVVNHTELNREMTERQQGDELVEYAGLSNAGELNAALATHNRTDPNRPGLFVVDTDFTTSTRAYVSGQRWQLAPHHTTEDAMLLVSEKGASTPAAAGGPVQYARYSVTDGIRLNHTDTAGVGLTFDSVEQQYNASGWAIGDSGTTITLEKGYYELQACMNLTPNATGGNGRYNLRLTVQNNADDAVIADIPRFGYGRAFGGFATAFPDSLDTSTVFEITQTTKVKVLWRTADIQTDNQFRYVDTRGSTVSLLRLQQGADGKDGKDGGPGPAGTPTTKEQIADLDLIPNPAGIRFTSPDELTAAVKRIEVGIPNPEILTGDVWVEGWVQGQRGLARRKWTTATSSLVMQLSDSIAGQISQGNFTSPQIEVRLRFYDSAVVGIEVERIGVNIPLINIAPDTQALTSAAAISWDVDKGNIATMTAGHNFTLTLTGGTNGTFAILRVLQDATGSRTMTLNNAIVLDGRTAPTLSTAAGAHDNILFMRRGTVWVYLGAIKQG